MRSPTRIPQPQTILTTIFFPAISPPFNLSSPSVTTASPPSRTWISGSLIAPVSTKRFSSKAYILDSSFRTNCFISTVSTRILDGIMALLEIIARGAKIPCFDVDMASMQKFAVFVPTKSIAFVMLSPAMLRTSATISTSVLPSRVTTW